MIMLMLLLTQCMKKSLYLHITGAMLTLVLAIILPLLTLSMSLLSQAVIIKRIFSLLTIMGFITMLTLKAPVTQLLLLILMELLLTLLLKKILVKKVIMKKMCCPSITMVFIILAQNHPLLVVQATQLLPVMIMLLLLLTIVIMRKTFFPSITMVFITMVGL